MKKPTGNISRIRYTSFIMVLILLVSFFSTCTIRKGIQSKFEVPVTKQLNPSKAVTNQQLVCHYSKNDGKEAVFIQHTFTGFGLLPLLQEDLLKPLTCLSIRKSKITSAWPLTSKVAFYILFRQFKSWINLSVSYMQNNSQS